MSFKDTVEALQAMQEELLLKKGAEASGKVSKILDDLLNGAITVKEAMNIGLELY